ncbi:very-long-chain (3R)-3-hydroxyacyl-CoA dehydratase [Phlebotomus argentipes]|uniref:very-long-chain (3R)-3-hydroxyacyl-CoA dehydratase n=1 Tax=Phlebotomus argentipes TaxID=94469 RepID=UPI002893463A|nr:very-long-chain (3R)-3-hydroxyacyl-CoA dehydratase [Phlebotomus argentipes]
MDVLNPLVLWSQTISRVILRVELEACQVDECTLTGRRLMFRGTGQGASGRRTYTFSLELIADVGPPSVAVSETNVYVTLPKVVLSRWSHLVAERLHFVRFDFDRWSDNEEEGQRNVVNDYPDVLQSLQRQELGYSREQSKKVYLALYNLLQFCGFLYIVIVLSIRIIRHGYIATHDSFLAVGSVFKFCQLMQFLEVLHPLFGYTNGSVIAPLMQTVGRAIVLFFAIDTDERIQRLTIVTYLFFVWASIELVRYPNYLLNLLQVKVALLEWLRYTLWIPLYPLGTLYEALILLRAAEFMEDSQHFAIRLPNAANVTFDPPLAIRVYVLVAILPGVSYLMTNMLRARRRRLKGRD